jgi:glutathione S-transferase
VRKVLWTCAELGLEVQHVPWGAGDLSLQSPEFLALNPLGLVPVLRDAASGLVLRESNTICRYLAGRAGRHDLLPADPSKRAQVEMWMDWMATELNNAWRHAFMGLVRKSPAHQDAEGIAASASAWNRQMAVLERALQRTGAFVTPLGFTLADIVLGLAVHRWFTTPIEHADLPAVAAYYERLTERPGFCQHGRNGIP